MTATVYIWPPDLTASMRVEEGFRSRVTLGWSGAPVQITAEEQRLRFTVSGETVRRNARSFDMFLERLRGGVGLALLFDAEMRIENGWANRIVVNDGNEARPVWNQDGGRGTYVEGQEGTMLGGDPNGGSGWRRAGVAASAANAGDENITGTGFYTGEVIPAGTRIAVNNRRYRTASTVTTGGTTAALPLASPLVADVANGEELFVPGDHAVCQLVPPIDVGPSDPDGVRSYALSFLEVFEAEVAGGWRYADIYNFNPG